MVAVGAVICTCAHSQSGSSHRAHVWSHSRLLQVSPAPTVASGLGAAIGASGLSHLICPITMDLLLDPVFTCDGHTFERLAIERWFETHRTSPLTGAGTDLVWIVWWSEVGTLSPQIPFPSCPSRAHHHAPSRTVAHRRAPSRTITHRHAPSRTITRRRAPPRAITRRRAPSRTITSAPSRRTPPHVPSQPTKDTPGIRPPTRPSLCTLSRSLFVTQESP